MVPSIPNEAVNYEFSQTVDLSNQGQTYVIEAKTNFSGDGYEPNDNFVKEVKHLLSNDVGVYDLVSPQSGQNLANESITVKLKKLWSSITIRIRCSIYFRFRITSYSVI